MTLDEWLEAEGVGALHRLHMRAAISLPVIARARKGHASLASAIKLHEHVGRKVRISSMTREIVPAALERPAPRRKVARGKRRRAA